VSSGLRERRKQETRLAISDIATVMFAEQGFDAVTISQVADAAGVSKMTVTNYFSRKEDLVFDRAGEVVGGLAAAVTNRHQGESLLDAVRRDYAEALARKDATLGVSSQRFAAMVAASPVLLGRVRELLEQQEEALAAAIAAETGENSVQNRLVAAQLAAVRRVLAAEAGRRSLAGQSREEIRAVLAAEADQAFGLLEPAIGGYLVRT
jgi:AcrR family transcriptional regulator